ncbi:unnamed protein product [Arctia plantaginis]|uniref:Uncharacterized protein n=1 Tax=Arctia plantaginis TaxID=874455 RepID=A0A8S0ZIF7_ARCPL|nr:unnamed protein product [Arctia plantaginis]
MSLQEFLVEKFSQFQPPAPEVISRSKYSVTLDWSNIEPFEFIADRLLYRLEKDNKIPPWIVVYRGGKTKKEIDNLAPRHPHKFRLKVIVQTEAVPTLADRAVLFYGSEEAVYEKLSGLNDKDQNSDGDNKMSIPNITVTQNLDDIETRGKADELKPVLRPSSAGNRPEHKWLECQWSEERWTNTDTDGTSIMCFCMAVRCGFIKELQCMLEERPELIGILNPTNGFSPLATAVRKGDINTIRFVLSAGADVNQPSATGQTPLHLAVLAARIPIAELLLEKGADFQAGDVNGLRVEHYAVESCDLEMIRYILDKGGDIHAQDNNGWTPLFRALCQGATTAIIEELVMRGSDLTVADGAGLPLTSVARIMNNRHGRNRDSVLRLVDMNYPHEIAMANFTRLTKKIHNVHTILRLPSLSKKPNLRQ